MKLSEAKSLNVGDYVHHVSLLNADNTPMRARVNGKVKTWKRSPDRVKVPFKRGLYEYGYITESDLNEFNVGYGS